MKKLITHKIISSILVLVFFVVSSVIVNAEQANQKSQVGKIKQLINNVGNKVNSGQILIKEQINKQLNSAKQEEIKKAFSGAIENIQQMTPEEKAKILNNAKNIINNVGSGNIAKIKNQIETKKQEIQKQKDGKIEEAKKQFEAKKQEIINQVKNGKLGNEDAKKQILANRDSLVNVAKTNIINEANRIKQEKISNVKSLIRKQFETKLADISKLSESEQKTKYQKLYNSIDLLTKKATKTQNEVYNIMREVLREKIDSLR